MNSRFKFRAWDKENKVLHYNAECAYDSMNGTPPLMHDSFGGLLDDDNFIIEQCTGLTDKNGKLIYEGDVVRYYRSTAMCLGGERIAQVLWDARDAEFGILTTLGDGYNMWEALRFGIEIIGNIHEDQFRDLTNLMEE